LQHRSQAVAFALMLVAVISWGASFVWLKMALVTLPPAGLAALRFSIASVVLLLLAVLVPGSRRQLQERSLWPTLLVIGFLGTFLPNLLQNYGMLFLDAGISGVVQGLGPIYTSILAVAFLGEGFGLRKKVGAGIALCGTILLSLGLYGIGRSSLMGVVLVTFSAVAYSAYTVAMRRSLLEAVHPLALLAGTTASGTIGLSMYAVLVEPLGPILSMGIAEIKVVMTLVIFPTLLAYGCYVLALSRLEASRAAAFIFLVPVSALLLGAIYLGETLSLGQILYSGLIVGGVALAESERQKGPNLA
jgi:drug/metabolite transporter (DMT)-like permease